MTGGQPEQPTTVAMSLVRCLQRNGDWSPILSTLAAGHIREVLSLVAEFDSELLLQLTEELLLEFRSTPG
jgi:hypothetical protein